MSESVFRWPESSAQKVKIHRTRSWLDVRVKRARSDETETDGACPKHSGWILTFERLSMAEGSNERLCENTGALESDD